MPDITIKDLIRQEAKAAGIPEWLALSVAEQESGFNPTALGPEFDGPGGKTRAIGTFQLLPTTAEMLEVDANDPIGNIRGGVKYLRQLIDRHQGNLDNVLREYGGVVKDQTYVPAVTARFAKWQKEGATVGSAAAAGGGAASETQINPPNPTAEAPKPKSRNLLLSPIEPLARAGRKLGDVIAGSPTPASTPIPGVETPEGVGGWAKALGEILMSPVRGYMDFAENLGPAISAAREPQSVGGRAAVAASGGQPVRDLTGPNVAAGRGFAGGVVESLSQATPIDVATTLLGIRTAKGRARAGGTSAPRERGRVAGTPQDTPYVLPGDAPLTNPALTPTMREMRPNIRRPGQKIEGRAEAGAPTKLASKLVGEDFGTPTNLENALASILDEARTGRDLRSILDRDTSTLPPDVEPAMPDLRSRSVGEGRELEGFIPDPGGNIGAANRSGASADRAPARFASTAREAAAEAKKAERKTRERAALEYEAGKAVAELNAAAKEAGLAPIVPKSKQKRMTYTRAEPPKPRNVATEEHPADILARQRRELDPRTTAKMEEAADEGRHAANRDVPKLDEVTTGAISRLKESGQALTDADMIKASGKPEGLLTELTEDALMAEYDRTARVSSGKTHGSPQATRHRLVMNEIARRERIKRANEGSPAAQAANKAIDEDPATALRPDVPAVRVDIPQEAIQRAVADTQTGRPSANFNPEPRLLKTSKAPGQEGRPSTLDLYDPKRDPATDAIIPEVPDNPVARRLEEQRQAVERRVASDPNYAGPMRRQSDATFNEIEGKLNTMRQTPEQIQAEILRRASAPRQGHAEAVMEILQKRGVDTSADRSFTRAEPAAATGGEPNTVRSIEDALAAASQSVLGQKKPTIFEKMMAKEAEKKAAAQPKPAEVSKPRAGEEDLPPSLRLSGENLAREVERAGTPPRGVDRELWATVNAAEMEARLLQAQGITDLRLVSAMHDFWGATETARRLFAPSTGEWVNKAADVAKVRELLRAPHKRRPIAAIADEMDRRFRHLIDDPNGFMRTEAIAAAAGAAAGGLLAATIEGEDAVDYWATTLGAAALGGALGGFGTRALAKAIRSKQLRKETGWEWVRRQWESTDSAEMLAGPAVFKASLGAFGGLASGLYEAFKMGGARRQAAAQAMRWFRRNAVPLYMKTLTGPAENLGRVGYYTGEAAAKRGLDIKQPAGNAVARLVLRPFVAADKVVSETLRRAGFSDAEAGRLVVNGEPTSWAGQALLKLTNSLFATRMLAKFPRVRIGGFERGIEYTPFLGEKLHKSLRPDKADVAKRYGNWAGGFKQQERLSRTQRRARAQFGGAALVAGTAYGYLRDPGFTEAGVTASLAGPAFMPASVGIQAGKVLKNKNTLANLGKVTAEIAGTIPQIEAKDVDPRRFLESRAPFKWMKQARELVK